MQRNARFQMVKQRLNRHPCAFKYRLSTQYRLVDAYDFPDVHTLKLHINPDESALRVRLRRGYGTTEAQRPLGKK